MKKYLIVTIFSTFVITFSLSVVTTYLILKNSSSSKTEINSSSQMSTAQSFDLDKYFSFNSPESSWTESELESLRNSLAEFTPGIIDLYGEPFATDNKINIAINPNLDEFSGVAFQGNLTLLNINNKAVIIHELTHAFHGNASINTKTYEEGFARAVEQIISEKYEIETTNHFTNYARFYDSYNLQQALSAAEGLITKGRGSQMNEEIRYELAAYGWTKAYIENKNFFKKFNEIYYAEFSSKGNNFLSEEELLSVLKQTQNSVENEPVEDWYKKQAIYDTRPHTGKMIFIEGMAGPSTIYILEKGSSVSTEMKYATNTKVNIEYFDFEGNQLHKSIEDSVKLCDKSDMNCLNRDGSFYIEPDLGDYKGLYKIKVSFNDNGKVISEESYGIYGYSENELNELGLCLMVVANNIEQITFEGEEFEISNGIASINKPEAGKYRVEYIQNEENKSTYVTKAEGTFCEIIQ